MTTYADKPQRVELLLATPEDEPVLSNLLQLYEYDFTEFLPLTLGSDGGFEYGSLSLYWTEPNRFPFIVRVDGRITGFALVKKGSEFSGDQTVWDMADFFIVRGERRRLVGQSAASEVWRRFPGRWEVRVLPNNIPALGFWSKAISNHTGKVVEPIYVTRRAASRYLFLFGTIES